jgi:hypothetical protein
MSRSDRERVEGFQRQGSSVVAVLFAVVSFPSERVEGFQRTPMSAVAVGVTGSEWVEGLSAPRIECGRGYSVCGHENS